MDCIKHEVQESTLKKKITRDVKEGKEAAIKHVC